MKIVKTDSKNYRKIIELVEKLIREGKVLVCPTDTVYGLIADATNKKAVNKIFKIKKRPRNKPIPIFVKDLKIAKKLALINKNQGKFLKKVWPGKITIVLKRKEGKQIYGIDKKTIALRVPNYKLVLELLKKIDKPLTGTSANISSHPPSTKIREVLKQFTLQRGSGQENQKYQPDLVIDAGNLSKSKPSTILDFTKSPPKILRK